MHLEGLVNLRSSQIASDAIWDKISIYVLYMYVTITEIGYSNLR